MSELDEILDVVDGQNKLVGQATRGECYEKGLLHRAVNIFIYNSKGQVFLHKRSDKKLKYPGFWDLSCSEHVRPGESFMEAAKRGLKEELGIEMPVQMIIPLHRVDSTDEREEYHDNELVVTFKGVYEGKFKFDSDEVSGGKFFDVLEVNNLIKSGKLQFTPWFLKEWKKYEEEELMEKRKKAVEGIIAFRKKYGKELAKGEDSTTIIRRMRDTRYGNPK